MRDGYEQEAGHRNGHLSAEAYALLNELTNCKLQIKPFLNSAVSLK